MQYLHQFSLVIHIIVGSCALILFWVPVLAKKGSKIHNQAGRAYTYSMQLVAISGILCCFLVLVDPITIYQAGYSQAQNKALFIETARERASFLLMLSFLVLTSVMHGVRVLQDKVSRQSLTRLDMIANYIALCCSALYVGYLGSRGGHVLYTVFSVISLVIVIRMMRYSFAQTVKPKQWVIEHLSAMIGSGIAAYTAFSAVGGRYLFVELLGEQAVLMAWLAPTVIGTIGLVITKRRYR
ncbi:hypothetical protein CWB99_19190 [Pseudoalteromonas rubra]|uniref:DUF2306 domain-containing protein n=1 Tax=Pseudoalteromonas rubra TaxID=43658 RepID=A0A5S3WHH8_9GAMM|nr:hypothetical protein [Pseudoalteromonas rubra]TMP26430.1 hypothetical protein CWB99_19190 [Pseudoalteromonas rubra]TMP29723.1 hypothetical protein CWC00_18740 [Pseudoalteromonas rubra]